MLSAFGHVIGALIGFALLAAMGPFVSLVVAFIIIYFLLSE